MTDSGLGSPVSFFSFSMHDWLHQGKSQTVVASRFLCPLVTGCANAVRPERLRLAGPVIGLWSRDRDVCIADLCGRRFPSISAIQQGLPWVNLQSANKCNESHCFSFSLGPVCDVSVLRASMMHGVKIYRSVVFLISFPS